LTEKGSYRNQRSNLILKKFCEFHPKVQGAVTLSAEKIVRLLFSQEVATPNLKPKMTFFEGESIGKGTVA